MNNSNHLVKNINNRISYPDVEVEAFAEALSTLCWILGEDGADVTGVAISSISAYGALDPFLLKALLKELLSYM